MKQEETDPKIQPRSSASPAVNSKVDAALVEFETRYNVVFTHYVIYPEDDLKSLHKAPIKSKQHFEHHIPPESDSSSMERHFKTFSDVANPEEPPSKDEGDKKPSAERFAKERNRYFNGLKAVYASLDKTPDEWLENPKVAFVAPKREGCVLAQNMGWQPFGRSSCPDVKRIPYEGGLLVGLTELHLEIQYDRAAIIDGAIASGATLMALMKSMANPEEVYPNRKANSIKDFDIYSVHATQESLNALSEFAKKTKIKVTLHVGKVTPGLNEHFYAIDADGKKVVGDLGDTIRGGDFWDSHDQLQNDLRHGRSAVLKYLSINKDAQILDLRFTLFALLCDTIYGAAKVYHGWKEDTAFYFWPGYDCVKQDGQGGGRMQLSTQLLDPDQKLGFEMPIDHGLSPPYEFADSLKTALDSVFSHRDEKLKGSFTHELSKGIDSPEGFFRPEDGDPLACRLLGNNASLWFTILLKPRQDPGFVVGSTHKWLEEEMKASEVTAESKKGRSTPRLSCLSVHCHNENKEETLRKSGSFYATNISRAHLTSSAQKVASQIKDCHTLVQDWPQLWYGSPEPEDSPHSKARLNLYSLWFHAVFDPESVSKWPDKCDTISNEALASFLRKIPGDDLSFPPPETSDVTPLPSEFHRLADKIRRGLKWTKAMKHSDKHRGLLEFVDKWSHYDYWYNLPIENSPALAGDAEASSGSSLGSAMLFSGERMKPIFLNVVRFWIQEIYLLFRSHENELMSRKQGELAGRVKVAHSLPFTVSVQLQKLQEAAEAVQMLKETAACFPVQSFKDLPDAIRQFTYPVELYSTAVNNALEQTRGGEGFDRLMPVIDWIDAAVEGGGFDEAFIRQVAEQIARPLARISLRRRGKPREPSASLLVAGAIPSGSLALRSLQDGRILVATLIECLREAFHHCAGDSPCIEVELVANGKASICVKNTCDERADSRLLSGGNQWDTLDRYAHHLTTWLIDQPQMAGGMWQRKLRRIS